MSLPRVYACSVIDLGTLAGLYEHQHALLAYCLACDRWRPLDLADLVRRGLGNRRLPITVRCRQCGKPGKLQVRPPMPTRSPNGWIEPPFRAADRVDAAAP